MAHRCRYSGRTASKLVATLLAGALIGAAAQTMQALIEMGVHWHNSMMKQVFPRGMLPTLGAEICISVCLVAAAGALVLLFAPLAAGGGVAVSWRCICCIPLPRTALMLLLPSILPDVLARSAAWPLAAVWAGPAACVHSCMHCTAPHRAAPHRAQHLASLASRSCLLGCCTAVCAWAGCFGGQQACRQASRASPGLHLRQAQPILPVQLHRVPSRLLRTALQPPSALPAQSVMAALNGNDIPGLLGWDVFAVKLVGCVLSRVASLAVGVEGPMVHLGACLASSMCRAEQGE